MIKDIVKAYFVCAVVAVDFNFIPWCLKEYVGLTLELCRGKFPVFSEGEGENCWDEFCLCFSLSSNLYFS